MTLRILSYNIEEGGGNRLDRIAEVIRQAHPDVVALLEAADRGNAEWLAGALNMQLVFGEANNEQDHVVWLSRLPISRSVNRRHPGLAKTLLEIEVVAGDEPVTLFATHLGSRWDVPQPADEIPIILKLMEGAAGTPHVLVGDFNALGPDDPVGQPPGGEPKRGEAIEGAPRPAIRRILAAGYVDCFRMLHPQAPGYTYPSHHPWLRLDYIFASPELAPHLGACEVVQGTAAATASDHFPMRAEFRW